jgi:hypothetical protein
MWTLAHPNVMVGNSPYVGQDPGAGWTQGAGTKQEQAQGYKKTDVMTLQIKCRALRDKVDALVEQVDPSTDAASLAALKSLQASCHALDANATQLAQGTPGYVYAQVLGNYNALSGQLAGFGIEEAAPPAPPPSAAAPAPVQKAPTVVQHAATPSAPVVTLKPSSGFFDKNWGYIAASVLVVVGGVLLKVARVF